MTLYCQSSAAHPVQHVCNALSMPYLLCNFEVEFRGRQTATFKVQVTYSQRMTQPLGQEKSLGKIKS